MPFNKVPTSLSLDRPSLHFDSVRPHFPIRLFGIRQYCNQYCKPRILSRLLATNASSCTTIVPLTHTHTDGQGRRPRVRPKREPPIGSSLAAGVLAISGADLRPCQSSIMLSWFGSLDPALIP
ncbi:hypothetical protein Tsp_14362 [Trichinella spiralis]|nr:hypothetical protein Tsp_14362 [Trichinella spiralis]